MKKHLMIVITICGLAVASSNAQELTPVFEHLISNDNVPLPILEAAPAETGDFQGSWTTNTWTMDVYGGFSRYDDERLLLGIRDNGINEENPDHDANLAALYPDRSLIWINESNGSYMGIALEIGMQPVEHDPAWLTSNENDPNTYFISFDVDEEGVIYVGFANQILRYEPDGNGGFNDPTVAYVLPADLAGDAFPGWEWSFGLSVQGSGTETAIVAGQHGDWRSGTGYFALKTSDGETFENTGKIPGGFGNAGGGASSLITIEGEEYVYVTTYPGSSNGTDTTFYRFFRAADSTDDFTKDTDLFNATGPELPEGEEPAYDEYQVRFMTTVEGHPDLDYVVAYSTPSWNSAALGIDPPRPGFLALHDVSGTGLVDGALISYHTLDVSEADEVIDPTEAEPTGYWQSTGGNVRIYRSANDAAGACEVLWHSGTYGYARYTIGETPIGNWSIY